jgi:hypothetical protein
MDASDLVKTPQNTLQGGGRPHMGLDPQIGATHVQHGCY